MENVASKPHLPILIFCFLAVFYLSASAWRDFHSRGEAREGLVMRHMLEQGNLILPEGYAGGVPSKPPLLHWFSTLFSWPFGEVTELTARLPSVFAACLIFFISLALFAPASSLATAMLSSLILASSFQWVRTASTARVDMLLTAALFAAFFALYRWSERDYQGYPWLLLISVASAILCKGPVGVVLPALVFVALSLIERVSLWLILKRGLLIFGPAVCVTALWYIAAYVTRQEKFLETVYYENVARFLSLQDDEPHKASALKLYGTVLLGFAPWTVLLLVLAWSNLTKVVSFNFHALPKLIGKRLAKLSRIDRFSLLVVAITIIFFSIPEGKRDVYVLPAYPFIAFWLARLFIMEAKSLESRLFLRSVRVAALISLFVLFIVLAFIFSPIQLIASLVPLSQRQLMLDAHLALSAYFTSQTIHFMALLLLSFFLVVLTIFSFKKAKRSNGLPWFLGLTLYFFFFAQVILVPAAVNPISPKIFARTLTSIVSPGTQLLSYGEAFYGISFYSGREFMRAEEVGFIPGSVLVIDESDDNKLHSEVLGNVKLELIMRSPSPVMKYGEYLRLYKIIG